MVVRSRPLSGHGTAFRIGIQSRSATRRYRPRENVSRDASRDLGSAGETRLVGAVEFQVTGADREVHTKVVHASEPVSAELPGDLAAAAGRLLRRLASDGMAVITSER